MGTLRILSHRLEVSYLPTVGFGYIPISTSKEEGLNTMWN